MHDGERGRLLVANRGEVAVRVLRTAYELGLPTVAITSADEVDARHTQLADDVVVLPGRGAAAYLDIAALVRAAVDREARFVHPGWGFLSEDAGFALACEEAGLTFVGPSSEVLQRLGDKVAARHLARSVGVPVLAGTDGPVGPEDAAAFLASLGPEAEVVVKAVSGGGGRGIRVVRDPDSLDEAYRACVAEAEAATGRPEVYLERRLSPARHVEVQLVADADGGVLALGDRDCSLQRRHQKLVELAPAPWLPAALHAELAEAAVRIGRAAGLQGLATVEFLVDPTALETAQGEGAHHFLEVNPRLQVEHTVTEAVTGLDLVALQLELAAGATLDEVDLPTAPVPVGTAVQARVTTSIPGPDGTVTAATGTLETFTIPGGPGVRVDTHAAPGSSISARFDPLLAKVVAVAPGPDPHVALGRLARALREFEITGVRTDLPLLRALVSHPEVVAGRVTTSFVEAHLDELLADLAPPDELEAATPDLLPPGTVPVVADLAGTVVTLPVAVGERVGPDTPIALVEAMKLQHVVTARRSGTLQHLRVAVGDELVPGTTVAVLVPSEDTTTGTDATDAVDLDAIRPELAELRERLHLLTDAARPDAVARRHGAGRRTARENLDDLCEPGSFVEYGGLAIAAQRGRRGLDDLIARTPADGLIGGIARVNGDAFEDDRAQTVVLSYDYLVLAGTQGVMGHRKKDRLFELTERLQRPVVLFAEGGGGRPGDTDQAMVAGLDTVAFGLWAGLSGVVPRIGIASGNCFAGNAALYGACDVTIATRDASIGMGGPAMIEGGGLGTVAPEDVGPIDVHVRNGVVDVAVEDDAAAVAAAKQVLAYFQGTTDRWDADDQRLLRHLLPEDRLRAYDVRRVVHTLADTASVLELRPRFAAGMVTAFARVEGRPIGIVANDPTHLAGAVTSDGADKAARFLQLCEAFDLPVLFLCDTPGIMVGTEAEATGLVRHSARLFLAGAALTVPTVTIVLRKGYGLGAQAMAGGSFRAPMLTVAWPTGEFGGMGLEGAVKLAMRKELEAIEDPEERQRVYEGAVAFAYGAGKALSMATYFEIDGVIDPADSRHVLLQVLRSAPAPAPRHGRKAGYVDAW